MNQKAVTISASQLIGFLDQELNELPDNRKGKNLMYENDHTLLGCVTCDRPGNRILNLKCEIQKLKSV